MVRKAIDLATVAGEALRTQYLAQDLSTSGLPAREVQPEQVPIAQKGEQEAAAITTEPPRRRRPKRSTTEDADQGAEKRAKIAEEDVAILRGTHSEATADGPGEVAPFVPNFGCPNGHVITEADSLAENQLLAMTLLRGLALPRDMENLPTGKANNIVEMCLFLAKVHS